MLSPFEKINQFITKYPFVIGCILIVMILIGIYGATGVSMNTTIQTPDKTDHASYVYQDYRDNFQTNSIVLMVQASDVRDVDVMKCVTAFEEILRQQNGVENVESIYDLILSYSGGVVPENQAVLDELFSKIPESVLAKSMPNNQLLLVKIDPTIGMTDENQQILLDTLANLLPLANAPPGVTLTFTGSDDHRSCSVVPSRPLHTSVHRFCGDRSSDDVWYHGSVPDPAVDGDDGRPADSSRNRY